jgi:hypothetical protein
MTKLKVRIFEPLKFGFDLKFELCHLNLIGFGYEIHCRLSHPF